MKGMLPEERFDRIERQLEFLAANQAHHDAQLVENARQIGAISKHTEENSRQIGQLADLSLRIGRIVEEQAHRMDDLAEAQRRTEERLNTLINVVERYFSNGK